ncbi:glutaminase A [uncultured Murdochiella sp.]|uniref:glutaminase A n=1 Tax=uncultured Murdochiella sp. TaxID=1586095 RepID=UPI0028053389|nr:glutaminase A [uncultured Murdochiella sp.]
MDIQGALLEAYHYGREYTDQGKVADYIPELAKQNPELVGATLISPENAVYSVGDDRYKFSAQSIAKIIIYLCVLETYDPDYVRQFIGVTPSSKPFNSILELELSHHNIPVNPFINAGAIVATSLLMQKYHENTFEKIRERTREVVGRKDLDYCHAIYLSESNSAYANRALTYMLLNDGIISTTQNVEDLLNAYFRACSLLVNSLDLAVIGSVLAHNGKNAQGEQVLSAENAAILRTVMATCGTYDYAGEFALLVGMPAKSGVGGGIVAATRSGYGIGVFSPRLDKHGNSYVGVRMLERLSTLLNLHIY